MISGFFSYQGGNLYNSIINSEQEIKYMMELNKPKEPRVFSNEEAYAFLNQFLKQGKKDKGKVIIWLNNLFLMSTIILVWTYAKLILFI